ATMVAQDAEAGTTGSTEEHGERLLPQGSLRARKARTTGSTEEHGGMAFAAKVTTVSQERLAVIERWLSLRFCFWRRGSRPGIFWRLKAIGEIPASCGDGLARDRFEARYRDSSVPGPSS